MAALPTFEFRPERLAYFEASGWRAYYDRDWLKLARPIVAVSQEQFRIPFPQSLLAGYYTARASMAWAPVQHDTGVVRAYLARFYRLARRYSHLACDPERAADLEVKSWIAHRERVGQPDKTRFIQSMVDLHCALFDLTPQQARESAEYRVLANDTVDVITGRLSTDVEGDWLKLQDYLRRAYLSLNRELEARRAGEPGADSLSLDPLDNMEKQTGRLVAQGIDAAREMVRLDHRRGLNALNEIFRAGVPPTRPLEGRYTGALVALDLKPGLTGLFTFLTSLWLPWQGKRFDARAACGDNLFTRASLPAARLLWPRYRRFADDGGDTYRGFEFRTAAAAGLFDHDRQVLRLDYGLDENPGLSVRRVVDELVEVADGLYLGKAHLHWLWGEWQTVAFFTLAR